MIDLEPFGLTAKLACCTTLGLFIVAVPLAAWLSGSKGIIRTLVEVVVTMPLVLPPSVIGFYLLVAFSPGSGLGALIERWFGVQFVFSFQGLLLASMIYSLPFMVHPIQSGLASLPPSLQEAAWSLGKTRWQTLWQVQLPNIRHQLLTALVLTFAHTVGEFGVVLMIGGNIAGKTRTASIAIYDEVEALHDHNANVYALVLVLVSFIILFTLYWTNRKRGHYPLW
jgi:molybdate transport system permease protein